MTGLRVDTFKIFNSRRGSRREDAAAFNHKTVQPARPAEPVCGHF